MEGTAVAGIVTGVAGSITAIATAFINRGTAAGVKETKAELDKLVTSVEALTKRLTTVEGTIATAEALASIPGEVAQLRAHIEAQLRAARSEWDTWKRAQRSATASQPALVDDEARREAAEAIRRVETLERERSEDRESGVQLQLQLARLETKLDLLLGGSIQLGGKSR